MCGDKNRQNRTLLSVGDTTENSRQTVNLERHMLLEHNQLFLKEVRLKWKDSKAQIVKGSKKQESKVVSRKARSLERMTRDKLCFPIFQPETSQASRTGGFLILQQEL